MTGDKNNARWAKYRRKYHLTQHKNLLYIYKEELVEETVTLDELKKLYYDFKSELDTKTQLIQRSKKGLIKLHV